MCYRQIYPHFRTNFTDAVPLAHIYAKSTASRKGKGRKFRSQIFFPNHQLISCSSPAAYTRFILALFLFCHMPIIRCTRMPNICVFANVHLHGSRRAHIRSHKFMYLMELTQLLHQAYIHRYRIKIAKEE